MSNASSESFADSSCAVTVERRVLCVQRPDAFRRICYRPILWQYRSSRLYSSLNLEAEINKLLQLVFAKTFPLKFTLQ